MQSNTGNFMLTSTDAPYMLMGLMDITILKAWRRF